MKRSMKIGVGIDYHCLVEGRALVLGGIMIPHHKGLDGHSDADVVLHAIADAMLGALALGDIGQHFPNTDMRWKNISSSVLLLHVKELMMKQGYVVGNVDTMLSIESPKIAPYILKMRTHIADILGVEVDAISVKATTTEGLGFVGREEGVSAHAVVLLQPM